MKTRDIGDIANLVAAVGVIISLLFVGYEINRNTEETRAANRQQVVAALRELTLTRADSPSLSAAIVAARSGRQITEVQLSQYTSYLFTVIKSVEEAWFQHREGRLDEEQLEFRIAGLLIADFLGNERGRALWEIASESGQIAPAFAATVDERLVGKED